eukprot:CAMPEP_0172727644 /NCGR_PEP_ID=MMETSP1074-20121228/91794_1 /TAXON_ID=2916 /ORGANISM="Ceratium fusus, Strain PA161109" /LENGTH=433 /DNA_ID=CAMNT_0013554817 /DNA_START=44 /DNA_END=1345 /DNA_ORIENTATION=-
MTRRPSGATTLPEKLGRRSKLHGPNRLSPRYPNLGQRCAATCQVPSPQSEPPGSAKVTVTGHSPYAPHFSWSSPGLLTARPTVGRANICVVASAGPSVFGARPLTARVSPATSSVGSSAKLPLPTEAVVTTEDVKHQLKTTALKRAKDGVSESSASKRIHCAFAAPLADRTRAVPVGTSPSSPVTAHGRMSLQFEELHQQDVGPFDLSRPEVRRQLLSRLGASSATTLERMPGYQGGLNDGVWSLCEHSTANRPQQEWILKLVKGTSTAVGMPTEVQCLQQVSQQHPVVFSDPLMAFPRMILSCICAGSKSHDLIVMPKAPGQRLCEVIAGKWHSGQRDELQKIVRQVGTAVARLHKKYRQVQHADMQPSNIFWDETSSRVTFIDVGGMALRCLNPDVEHFEKSLRMLSQAYGPEFGVESIPAFHEGYASASS